MLAEAGEDECIKCLHDITGKELPQQAVKQAREQELKYLRELGVYEKVVQANMCEHTRMVQGVFAVRMSYLSI